jgi:hypothetical protein
MIDTLYTKDKLILLRQDRFNLSNGGESSQSQGNLHIDLQTHRIPTLSNKYIYIKHICHYMPSRKVAQDCQVEKVTSGNYYLV